MVQRSLLKIAGVVFAAVLVASLLGCKAAAPAPPTAETAVEVKIGEMRSLTGVSAAYLIRCWRGYDDYKRYLDETDPIPGVKIVEMWEETGYIADRYIAAYKRFQDAGMVAIGSMMESAATNALAERMRTDKIPGITSTMGTHVISNPGYIFPTNSPGWDGQAIPGKFFMEKWKAAGYTQKPKAMLIGVDSPSWATGWDMIEAYWRSLGFETLPGVIFPLATTELASHIARGKERGANLIVFTGNINFMPMMVNDAARVGIDRGFGPGKTDIAISGMSVTEMAKVGAEQSQGYWYASNTWRSVDALNWGAAGVETTLPGLKLIEALQIKYHGAIYYEANDINGGQHISTMHEAIKRAAAKYGPKGVNSAAIYEMLITTTDFDSMLGLYQLISWTATERRSTKTYFPYEWRNGKFNQIGPEAGYEWLTPADSAPELGGFRIK